MYGSGIVEQDGMKSAAHLRFDLFSHSIQILSILSIRCMQYMLVKKS